MLTTIVDIHVVNHIRPDFDLYIGRASKYAKDPRLKKNSIWYNPFYANDYDPTRIQDCLRDYEIYIREKIAKDPVKYDLRSLIGKRLGCWCITTTSFTEPLRCHGQVLLKLIAEFYPEIPPCGSYKEGICDGTNQPCIPDCIGWGHNDGVCF